MVNEASSIITLSLVVPCFNEETTLAACVERCLALESEDLRLELIVVDDCSNDGSLAVARKLEKKFGQVRVLSHGRNRGKGAALRTGFAAASGDFVGVQDADLEYDPLDYRVLLQPMLENRADVVFGSRYLKSDARRVLYFWHTWMNQTLTFISNMFTNLDITDMETCYKLFRRDVVASLDLHEDRFGFEPEVVAKVAQKSWRVYECAISYAPRTYEEGKKIDWKDGAWALYCIFHYSAHCAPLPMQLLLYFFIGGVSGVANVTAFAWIYAIGSSLTTAVALAFILAAALNYFLCIQILFRHKARWSASGEIGLYVLTVFLMGMFDILATTTFVGFGLGALASKVLSTFLGFIGNFVLRKYLVFPERRPAGRL